MGAAAATEWQTMSTAPSGRDVLFKVPLGSSAFFQAIVGRFDPMRGWVDTIQDGTAARIFPTAWTAIPDFDDDDLPRTLADEAARIRPLKKAGEQ
jgi:hypothetical protein